MGVYPVMYALLDIERTIRGLPELEGIEFFDPTLGIGGPLYWSEDVRHRRIRELLQSLKSDLEWLAEEASLNEGVYNAIAFVLGGAPLDPKSVTVSFTARDQTVLADALYSRYALAEVWFGGEKNELLLGTEYPEHAVVLAFLKAVQPFHAFVTGDNMSPSEDRDYFQGQWRRVEVSTFLGPELVSLIPPNLLAREAGFAHLEQVGSGLWLTVPVGMKMHSGQWLDSVTLERHWQACHMLEAFLETLPSLLASERE